MAFRRLQSMEDIAVDVRRRPEIRSIGQCLRDYARVAPQVHNYNQSSWGKHLEVRSAITGAWKAANFIPLDEEGRPSVPSWTLGGETKSELEARMDHDQQRAFLKSNGVFVQKLPSGVELGLYGNVGLLTLTTLGGRCMMETNGAAQTLKFMLAGSQASPTPDNVVISGFLGISFFPVIVTEFSEVVLPRVEAMDVTMLGSAHPTLMLRPQ